MNPKGIILLVGIACVSMATWTIRWIWKKTKEIEDEN